MEDGLPLNSSNKTVKETNEKTVKNELPNILFLMFLYMLQGVPTGLLYSIQFILGSKNVSYTDQGTFTLAGWPFTIKLLWAPFVDSFYWKRIGRRKSWLVPVQYLLGALLILSASYVNRVLYDPDENIHDEIYYITGLFTVFIMLAATQDIAVDGWGITILSEENLEWASVCNNAGATIGILIGHSVFLVLDSADFCNNYIRSVLGLELQSYGLINLKLFMIFFGILFIASTTLILFFKNEKTETYYDHIDEDASFKNTIQSLWSIIKLKPMMKFMSFLLTWNMAFALTRIKNIKLLEAGLSKVTLGLVTIPFQLVQIITPIIISNMFINKKPMKSFFIFYPGRMVITAIFAAFIYSSPFFKNPNGEFAYSFIIIFAILNGIYSLLSAGLDMYKVYFYAQISDKTIGATYMTLLHTVSNIGFNWPMTLAFYLLEYFTVKNCIINMHTNSTNTWQNETIPIQYQFVNNTCSSDIQKEACDQFGGNCVIETDAFYYLTAINLGFGVVWWMFYSRIITKLQKLPQSAWRYVEASRF